MAAPRPGVPTPARPAREVTVAVSRAFPAPAALARKPESPGKARLPMRRTVGRAGEGRPREARAGKRGPTPRRRPELLHRMGEPEMGPTRLPAPSTMRIRGMLVPG